MYKDIVVRLDMGNGNKAVVDYAVSAARVLGAHITGIAIAFIPNIPGASMGYLPIGKIEATQQANEDAAEAAAEYFIKATASAEVSSEAQILRADFSKAAQQFSRVALVVPYIQKMQLNSTASWCAGMAAEQRYGQSPMPYHFSKKQRKLRSSKSSRANDIKRKSSMVQTWACTLLATDSKCKSRVFSKTTSTPLMPCSHTPLILALIL